MSTIQIFILILMYIIGVFVTFNVVKEYFVRIKNYKELIVLIGLSLLSCIGIILFSIFLTIDNIINKKYDFIYKN